MLDQEEPTTTTQDVYAFLQGVQLEQFYHQIHHELHLTRLSHFDHVTAQDLTDICMSKPEQRRLFDALKKHRKEKKKSIFSLKKTRKKSISLLVAISPKHGEKSSSKNAKIKDISPPLGDSFSHIAHRSEGETPNWGLVMSDDRHMAEEQIPLNLPTKLISVGDDRLDSEDFVLLDNVSIDACSINTFDTTSLSSRASSTHYYNHTQRSFADSGYYSNRNTEYEAVSGGGGRHMQPEVWPVRRASTASTASAGQRYRDVSQCTDIRPSLPPKQKVVVVGGTISPPRGDVASPRDTPGGEERDVDNEESIYASPRQFSKSHEAIFSAYEIFPDDIYSSPVAIATESSTKDCGSYTPSEAQLREIPRESPEAFYSNYQNLADDIYSSPVAIATECSTKDCGCYTPSEAQSREIPRESPEAFYSNYENFADDIYSSPAPIATEASTKDGGCHMFSGEQSREIPRGRESPEAIHSNYETFADDIYSSPVPIATEARTRDGGFGALPEAQSREIPRERESPEAIHSNYETFADDIYSPVPVATDVSTKYGRYQMFAEEQSTEFPRERESPEEIYSNYETFAYDIYSSPVPVATKGRTRNARCHTLPEAQLRELSRQCKSVASLTSEAAVAEDIYEDMDKYRKAGDVVQAIGTRTPPPVPKKRRPLKRIQSERAIGHVDTIYAVPRTSWRSSENVTVRRTSLGNPPLFGEPGDPTDAYQYLPKGSINCRRSTQDFESPDETYDYLDRKNSCVSENACSEDDGYCFNVYEAPRSLRDEWTFQDEQSPQDDGPWVLREASLSPIDRHAYVEISGDPGRRSRRESSQDGEEGSDIIKTFGQISADFADLDLVCDRLRLPGDDTSCNRQELTHSKSVCQVNERDDLGANKRFSADPDSLSRYNNAGYSTAAQNFTQSLSYTGQRPSRDYTSHTKLSLVTTV